MGFPKIQRSSHTVAGTASGLNRIPFYPRGAPSGAFLAELLQCDKEIQPLPAIRHPRTREARVLLATVVSTRRS
ncbi:MAG: hypothetical protein ACJAVO_002063 [Parvibaculaceae bacterium]|jgi:hypothetical protein